jgi:hypothetical protein
MDEELRAIDAQNQVLNMELLHSHFSDYTSGVGSEMYPNLSPENSRFSEWSTDTEMVSPASMTSSSTFNPDQTHTSTFSDSAAWPAVLKPALASSSGPTTPTLSGPQLPSPTTVASHSPVLRSSTATSNADLGIPALCIEDLDDFVEDNPKRHAGMFPSLETLTPLSISNGDKPDQLHPSNAFDEKHSGSYRQSVGYLAQSAAMKELMDELGYLGDMIQAEL